MHVDKYHCILHTFSFSQRPESPSCVAVFVEAIVAQASLVHAGYTTGRLTSVPEHLQVEGGTTRIFRKAKNRPANMQKMIFCVFLTSQGGPGELPAKMFLLEKQASQFAKLDDFLHCSCVFVQAIEK